MDGWMGGQTGGWVGGWIKHGCANSPMLNARGVERPSLTSPRFQLCVRGSLKGHAPVDVGIALRACWSCYVYDRQRWVMGDGSSQIADDTSTRRVWLRHRGCGCCHGRRRHRRHLDNCPRLRILFPGWCSPYPPRSSACGLGRRMKRAAHFHAQGDAKGVAGGGEAYREITAEHEEGSRCPGTFHLGPAIFS